MTREREPQSEETEYLWGSFLDWAGDNGVGVEYEEDYDAWWQCWKAAIAAERGIEP